MQRTSRSRATKVKYCEDVNNEFFTRFYDLLYTNFTKEEPKSIMTFPPMKPGSEVKPEPSQAFNSRIADLRVKRAHDKRVNNNQTDEDKKLRKRMKKLEKETKENNESIDEIFERVGVPRAEVPVYVANAQKDEEAMRLKRKTNKKHEDLQQVKKQFTERLQQASQKGKNRAIQRYEKITTHKHPKYRSDQSPESSPRRNNNKQ